MAYSILVADDSAVVRAVLRKSLEAAGIKAELHQAENGQEALDLLSEEWIDLVLTDINMPEMDGMELVRRMSEDGMMKTVPVVVISTEGSESRVEELKEWGIKGFIRKPFTPEQIKEMVEDVLGN